MSVCILYQYNVIKIFSVCASVCVAVTNLRVVCKTITCASAFTEMAILSFFLEIIIILQVKAAAGLDTLRYRLLERCHCGRLTSHYRRARTQDYLACWTGTRHDFSLTCHSVQRARQPLSRRAISGGSFTVAGDFVLQLIRLESLGSKLQELTTLLNPVAM